MAAGTQMGWLRSANPRETRMHNSQVVHHEIHCHGLKLPGRVSVLDGFGAKMAELLPDCVMQAAGGSTPAGEHGPEHVAGSCWYWLGGQAGCLPAGGFLLGWEP